MKTTMKTFDSVEFDCRDCWLWIMGKDANGQIMLVDGPNTSERVRDLARKAERAGAKCTFV